MNDFGSAQTMFDPAFGVDRAPASEVDVALLREQLTRVRETVLLSFLPTLVLAAAHIGSVSPMPLATWLVLMGLVLLLRRHNAVRMLKLPLLGPSDFRHQFRIEWISSVLAGLAWGSCMWLLSTGQADSLFLFRMMFLAGVCAVALGITGLAPLIYGSFVAVLLGSAAGFAYLDAAVLLSSNLFFYGLMLIFFGLLVFRSAGESRMARERIESRMNQALLVQRLRDLVLEQQSVQMDLENKSADLERSNQRLNELAIHDGLTGAYNRGHVQELLRQSVARYNRYRQPLCVMMIDLDHFKKVNDQYGHAAGDDVLRQVSVKAAACLREGDVFGRWGGEEFIALLPSITLQGATDVAERLRLGIAELQFQAEARGFSVTTSIGVAQILDGETAESLVDRADAALYAAKDAGRNCVMLAQELIRPRVAAA